MRVVVAGLSRSGSTLLFNIVAAAFPVLKCSVHSHVLDKLLDCIARCYSDLKVGCVVKTHKFDSNLIRFADVVVSSHRNLKDVLLSSTLSLSSCSMAGTQPVVPSLSHYLAWLPYACLDFSYERMYRHPSEIFSQLATLFDADKGLMRKRYRSRMSSNPRVHGMMERHVSKITTQPQSSRHWRAKLELFMTSCNLTRELRLMRQLNRRFGRSQLRPTPRAQDCPLASWNVTTQVFKLQPSELHTAFYAARGSSQFMGRTKNGIDL